MNSCLGETTYVEPTFFDGPNLATYEEGARPPCAVCARGARAEPEVCAEQGTLTILMRFRLTATTRPQSRPEVKDVLFLESNLASRERVSESFFLGRQENLRAIQSTIPRVMPGLAVRPVAIERNHSAKPRRNS